jgi:hypothetical protein
MEHNHFLTFQLCPAKGCDPKGNLVPLQLSSSPLEGYLPGPDLMNVGTRMLLAFSLQEHVTV